MRRQKEADTENKEPERREMGGEVEREIEDDEALGDEDLDDEMDEDLEDEDTEERQPQRGEIEHGDKSREGGTAEVDDRVAWRPEDQEPDSADRRS
jgi:hypothetical protein